MAAQVAHFRSESTSPIAPILSTKTVRHPTSMATASSINGAATNGSSTSNFEGITALMLACQQGQSEDVQKILRKKNTAVKERTRSGKVALHFCAESGSSSCIDHVLAAEPFLINAQDEEGYTPLHLAVINGNKDIVRKLIAAGADLNCLDNERHSLVHWATVCGEVEILEILLSNGSPASTPDIHLAHPIHYAAQMCGSVNGVGSVSRARVQSTVHGVSPKKGLQILKRLVQFGCPIDVRDVDGRQPLLWAASAGSGDAILLLVNAGGKVDAEDKDGLTALHCAASRGNTDCIETLIGLCGAEVDLIDNNGCTSLFYAVTLGHADSTELLLNFGSEPNRQDRKGRTPGHCGAAKGQLETLKLLARHGGNLWLRNVRGDLALHEAVISKRKDLVMWLLSLRPDAVNTSNNDGRCPIHLAALNNNVEMVKILIDHRAEVNVLMRSGKGTAMTPLDAAIHRGNSAVAKFLQLHGGLPSNSLNDAALHRRLNRSSVEGQISPAASSIRGSNLGSNHHPSPEDQQLNFTSPEVFDSSLIHYSRNSQIHNPYEKRGTHATSPFVATSTPIMDDGVQTDPHFFRDMEVQTMQEHVEEKQQGSKQRDNSHRKSDRRRRMRSNQDGHDSSSGSSVERSSNQLVSRTSRKSSRKSGKGSGTSGSKSQSHSSSRNSEEKTRKARRENNSAEKDDETDSTSHSRDKKKALTPQGSSDTMLDNTLMSEKFSELENVAVQSSETDARDEELGPPDEVEKSIKEGTELKGKDNSKLKKKSSKSEQDRESESDGNKTKSLKHKSTSIEEEGDDKSSHTSPETTKTRSKSRDKSNERKSSAKETPGRSKSKSKSKSRETSAEKKSSAKDSKRHRTRSQSKSKSRDLNTERKTSAHATTTSSDKPKSNSKSRDSSSGIRSSEEETSSARAQSKSKSKDLSPKRKSSANKTEDSRDRPKSKSKSRDISTERKSSAKEIEVTRDRPKSKSKSRDISTEKKSSAEEIEDSRDRPKSKSKPRESSAKNKSSDTDPSATKRPKSKSKSRELSPEKKSSDTETADSPDRPKSKSKSREMSLDKKSSDTEAADSPDRPKSKSKSRELSSEKKSSGTETTDTPDRPKSKSKSRELSPEKKLSDTESLDPPDRPKSKSKSRDVSKEKKSSDSETVDNCDQPKTTSRESSHERKSSGKTPSDNNGQSRANSEARDLTPERKSSGKKILTKSIESELETRPKSKSKERSLSAKSIGRPSTGSKKKESRSRSASANQSRPASQHKSTEIVDSEAKASTAEDSSEDRESKTKEQDSRSGSARKSRSRSPPEKKTISRKNSSLKSRVQSGKAGSVSWHDEADNKPEEKQESKMDSKSKLESVEVEKELKSTESRSSSREEQQNSENNSQPNSKELELKEDGKKSRSSSAKKLEKSQTQGASKRIRARSMEFREKDTAPSHSNSDDEEREIPDEIEAGKLINLRDAAQRRSHSRSRSQSLTKSSKDSSLDSPSKKKMSPRPLKLKPVKNRRVPSRSEEREIELQEALLASRKNLRPKGTTVTKSKVSGSPTKDKASLKQGQKIRASQIPRRSSEDNDIANDSNVRDSGFSDPLGLTTSASEDHNSKLNTQGKSHVSMKRKVVTRRPGSGSARRATIFSSYPKQYRAPRTDRKRFDTLIVSQLTIDHHNGDETNSTSTRDGSISSEDVVEGMNSPRRRRTNANKPRSGLTFSRGEDVRDSRLSPRPRKNMDVETSISVTQAMQASMRKYNLERTVFQELLELKRLQIRAGKTNEQMLVKRLADNYKKAGYSVNFRDYDGPFTFRGFEKFLYDQLRVLQSNRRLLPRFAPSDDLEKLSLALKKMNATKLPFLEETERSESTTCDSQCAHSTHRCHHAAHAYTGVPCAAYIGNRKNGFLPKVNPLKAPGPTQKDSGGKTTTTSSSRNGLNGMNLSSPMQISISPRTDTQSPITLEVQQGSNTQVFTLPTKALDPSKNYYVSLSIKPNPTSTSNSPVPSSSENMTNRPSPAGESVDDGSISAPPPPAENDADIHVDVDREKHNRSM